MSARPRRVWVAGALMLVLLACGPDELAVPSRSTKPSVSLEQSSAWLSYDPGVPKVDPVFGRGSADLSVTFVEAARFNPTFDLGAPSKTALKGYGRYRGYQEVYRRSLAVDSNGIHGVRTAVYRTDEARNHTNVWVFHQAKDLKGNIYVTEYAQWDWLSGNEDLTAYDPVALPQLEDLERAGMWNASMFGLTPTVFSNSDYTYWRMKHALVESPTYHIEGCSQVYFRGDLDRSRDYVVYLHPDHGLVEIVYEWDPADPENPENHIKLLVPRDGFAVAPEDLPEVLDPKKRIDSPLEGFWEGTAHRITEGKYFSEIAETDAQSFQVQLNFDSFASNRREVAGVYELSGGYSDPNFVYSPFLAKLYREQMTLRIVTDDGPGYAWLNGHYDAAADQLVLRGWRWPYQLPRPGEAEPERGSPEWSACGYASECQGFEVTLRRGIHPSDLMNCRFNGLECVERSNVLGPVRVINAQDFVTALGFWNPDTGELSFALGVGAETDYLDPHDVAGDWAVQLQGYPLYTVRDIGYYNEQGQWVFTVADLMWGPDR